MLRKTRKLSFICKSCGKTFVAYRLAHGKPRQYCSYKCWVRGRDHTRVVGFCQPKHPDLSASPSLAYILGVLKGDGYTTVYMNRKKTDFLIGLGVNDLEFAQSFAGTLQNIGLNPKLVDLNKYQNQTVRWRTVASNREFVSWYRKLSLPDILGMLATSRELTLYFFKGFYEAEGYLGLEQDGRQRWGKPRCILSIANSDKPLLEGIQALMWSLGFDFRLYEVPYQRESRVLNGRVVKFKKRVYRLDLQKRKQVENLLTEIEPSIPRKRCLPSG